MFGGGDSSPVSPQVEAWIERSLSRFEQRFGTSAPHRPVVLPTAEFFPGPFTGTDAEIREVIELVTGFMAVEPDEVRVEFSRGIGVLSQPAPFVRCVNYFTSWHHDQTGRTEIAFDSALAARPVALVATISHGLAHHLLLSDNPLAAADDDHEELADLLTVYGGLGVFTANAAFTFTPGRRDGGSFYMPRGDWSASRQGYLTEQTYGYALARYARMRGETRPPWAAHLHTNPRAYMKQSLRYLARRDGKAPLRQDRP